ncbi:MAG: lanthionine synthetase LanC family protein [Balneolaceae bacterium]
MCVQKTEIEKQFLLQKAELIGRQLMELSESDAVGQAWSVPVQTYDGIKNELSFDIENGAAGICLFYIELFRQTKKQMYLDTAIQCGRWIASVCSKNRTDHYGFLNGYAGFAYVLIELSRVTEEAIWLDRASEMLRPCTEEFLSSPFTSNGLFNGRAGTLLVLLHLHSLHPQEWLTDALNAFIHRLLNECMLEKRGISWLDSAAHIKPLCNYAEGTAGISRVFLELGAYSGNDAYFDVAQQAIHYENDRWSSELRNWPDFRKEILNEQDHFLHIELTSNGAPDFFNRPAGNTSLAYGTAGIGINRLRALSFMPGDVPEDDLEKALNKLKETETDSDISFSLIEGPLSHLPFLMEYYKTNGYEDVFGMVENLAGTVVLNETLHESLLNDKKLGLIHGLAGVGMICLSFVNKERPFTIIKPVVKYKGSDNEKILSLSVHNIHKKILSSSFGSTISLLNEVAPKELDEYLNRGGEKRTQSEKNDFIEFTEQLVIDIKHPGREQLADVFAFEKMKSELRDKYYNRALRNAEEIVNQIEAEKILNRTDEQILNEKLVLTPNGHLVETKWKWFGGGRSNGQKELTANLQKEPGEFTVLLRLNSGVSGIQELWLGDLSAMILTGFSKPERGNNLIQRIIDEQDITEEGEITKLRKIAAEQIKEFIHACILVKHERQPLR